MTATLLFPHETIRPIQKDVITDIAAALENKDHIIIHAPTGLGKSAAALSAAVTYALKNNCTVFFLTSRHTQHLIAIQTLQEIKKRHNASFAVADIIGKKWMCLFPKVDELSSGEFTEFCKATVNAGKCDFYSNVRTGFKLTPDAQVILHDAKEKIFHTEEMIHGCRTHTLCPYEITLELVKGAKVIVGDYSYIFHPVISEIFLKKTGKKLENSIVIVDEGHNLPNRVRNNASTKLTSFMIKNALKEARKYKYKETIETLVGLQNMLNAFSSGLTLGQQKLITREQIISAVEKVKQYEKLIEDLYFIGDAIRELQKKSAISGIAHFLEAWKWEGDGFARFIEIIKTYTEEGIALQYKCLDPGVITAKIINETQSTIIMSGTLTPTNMYRDILGFEKERTREFLYENPFPEKNRLAVVVPKTTTKFTERGEHQFIAIAEECTKITDAIKGNTIIFFPSYSLRNNIAVHFTKVSKKTIFTEIPGMTKEEKTALLENFKEYKETGAVMLAVVSGSYGEGIDLPGDLLRGVIVVGLPLIAPDLETKQLIDYFEKKFQRGWDYGYVFPAFNKILQNAGRCIRTETDRGVIVFLDERYAWPMYNRCFPEDLHVEMSGTPEEDIRLFFGNKEN